MGNKKKLISYYFKIEDYIERKKNVKKVTTVII
jgi:hypothetical protein